MTEWAVSKITGQPLPWEVTPTEAPTPKTYGVEPPPPSPPLSDVRRAIHNEQVKLRATYLNTTAAGFIVAGLITPLTALGVGTGATVVSPHQALALMGIWLVFSVILHFGGLLTLEATL